MAEYRVNVYHNEYSNNGESQIIARVRYNNILDYWDGRNWTNGGNGMHKGLTKLRDGSYVLIIGSQWQGDRDYGFVIDKERALQEILKSGNHDLLKMKKWKELKELYTSTMIDEDEDEDEEMEIWKKI